MTSIEEACADYKHWKILKHGCVSMPYWKVNIICTKYLGQPKTTASAKVVSKGNGTMEPEPTRQTGRAPDRVLKISHYCLWQRLQWTRTDWRVVSQQLSTVWSNKIGGNDSLARHLLLLAYESSVGGNGQIIFDRTCYRSTTCFEPKRQKVPQQRPQVKILGWNRREI